MCYWKRIALLEDCSFICWLTCLWNLCYPRGYICCFRVRESNDWIRLNLIICCISSQPLASRSLCSASLGLSLALWWSLSVRRFSWGSFLSRGSWITKDVPSCFFFLEVVVDLLLGLFQVFVFLLFLLQFLFHAFSLTLEEVLVLARRGLFVDSVFLQFTQGSFLWLL